jgi:superfamily II DNA or RNA helicase
VRLRSYQTKCVERILEEWTTVISTLASLPTGGGKTVVACEVIRKIIPKRCMFVAHRRELLTQTKATLSGFKIECDLEMGEFRATNTIFSPPVVCAMVQTLNSKSAEGVRRLRRFDPNEFGLLIIDEAHHGVCDSYQEIIAHFKQNPNLKILLLTATADRLSEESLGAICDTVAFNYEILDAINDGWLVEPHQQFVAIEGLDFSHIKTTDGDIDGPELAEVMEMERNLQAVADATLKVAGGKRTLIFTVSVKQAEMLSNILNRHRPGCAGWICGKHGTDKRDELLEAFDSGRVPIMVNVGVLTEGYDSPGVEVIVQARLTKSRSFYAQTVGRALRPLPGLVDGLTTAEKRKASIAGSKKPNCVVLDFVGNSGRHKLVSVADLLGGNVSEEAIEKVVETAKKAMVPVRISQEIIDAEARIQKATRERRLAEEARRVKLVANATFSLRTVSPFDVFDLSPVKERGWDSAKNISEKERDFFLKQHIDPDGLTQPQRTQLRKTMFMRWKLKLATLKQCAFLKRRIPTLDTRGLTMKVAGEMISKMKDEPI